MLKIELITIFFLDLKKVAVHWAAMTILSKEYNRIPARTITKSVFNYWRHRES